MLKGKIEIQSRIPIDNLSEGRRAGKGGDEELEEGILDLIYTPGVAYVAKEINNNKELAYKTHRNGITLLLSVMAHGYLVSVILDLKEQFLLWKESLFYSKLLVVSTHLHYVYPPKTRKRLSV
jgi:hypothetical protein